MNTVRFCLILNNTKAVAQWQLVPCSFRRVPDWGSFTRTGISSVTKSKTCTRKKSDLGIGLLQSKRCQEQEGSCLMFCGGAGLTQCSLKPLLDVHSHTLFVLSFTLVYLEQSDNQSDPSVLASTLRPFAPVTSSSRTTCTYSLCRSLARCYSDKTDVRAKYAKLVQELGNDSFSSCNSASQCDASGCIWKNLEPNLIQSAFRAMLTLKFIHSSNDVGSGDSSNYIQNIKYNYK